MGFDSAAVLLGSLAHPLQNNNSAYFDRLCAANIASTINVRAPGDGEGGRIGRTGQNESLWWEARWIGTAT